MISGDVFCCGKSRCQVCHVMSNGKHFYSSTDSREYIINCSLTCDSSNVVYLWNVLYVVYNILVVPKRPLGLGFTIVRCAVVSLIRRLSTPGGIIQTF